MTTLKDCVVEEILSDVFNNDFFSRVCECKCFLEVSTKIDY